MGVSGTRFIDYFSPISAVYEDDHGREVSRNAEVEPLLHEYREESEAHDGMEDNSRETGRVRQR